jgi:translation initiation factor 2 alpha subunit (eIF-2alpha)
MSKKSEAKEVMANAIRWCNNILVDVNANQGLHCLTPEGQEKIQEVLKNLSEVHKLFKKTGD